MIPWDAPVSLGPIQATVTVPGSKSASARAYLLAALADGTSELSGVLDARDTLLMRAALVALGVRFSDTGSGSVIVEPPMAFTGGGVVECGLSGTVMRFVPAMAILASGTTRFRGDAGAEKRPVAPLLAALAELGAEIEGTSLPFSVTGRPDFPGGEVYIDSSASSQFISALLLAGCRYAKGVVVHHRGPTLPSRPHLEMTVTMLRARGVQVSQIDTDSWEVHPGRIRAVTERVEPDLTNAATFAAAALVTRGRVTTAWPEISLQAAGALLDVLAAFGATITRHGHEVTVDGSAGLSGADVDLHQVSEITCAVAALAALSEGPTTIRGVAHVRGHETDRLAALETEINRLGGRVSQTTDGLHIQPTALSGGPFRTYADHRMAHAGALIGLVTPGVQLDDVSCTSKTLPDFPGLWTRMLQETS